MSDETEIDGMVAAAVAKYFDPLIDEQRAGTRAAKAEIAACALRERIRDAAIAHGVIARSTRFVLQDAEAIFEWSAAGDVVAKDGARQPGNPLQPLTLAWWLEDLREREPHLFTRPRA